MKHRYYGRLGIVSTSRSGSTYFRRYLCNHYGLLDSKSWLKHNHYKNIDNEKFAQNPHILKILPHYILDESIYEDVPCIWLHRKDLVTQFMSHVARLRTKINHITDIKDRPNIPDNSLHATFNEFEKFQLKQYEFWMLYEKYGNDEELISYEDFLESPDLVIEKLDKKYYFPLQTIKSNLTLTVPLSILYINKFKNYSEIKEWFCEQ
jgi:hypothetical protein